MLPFGRRCSIENSFFFHSSWRLSLKLPTETSRFKKLDKITSNGKLNHVSFNLIRNSCIQCGNCLIKIPISGEFCNLLTILVLETIATDPERKQRTTRDMRMQMICQFTNQTFAIISKNFQVKDVKTIYYTRLSERWHWVSCLVMQ